MLGDDQEWHCFPMQENEVFQPSYIGEFRIVKAKHYDCILCQRDECQQTTNGNGEIYHNLPLAN